MVKSQSPVTWHKQNTVTCYRTDTNQCHLLRGRNRAKILISLTNIQPTTFSHSNAQMPSLFTGNYKLMNQHASPGAGAAEMASGLGYGLDDRGTVVWFLLNGFRGHPGVHLTIHFHLLRRLGMSGAIRLLPHIYLLQNFQASYKSQALLFNGHPGPFTRGEKTAAWSWRLTTI